MASSWANKQGKKFWPGLKEVGLGLLDIGQSGLIGAAKGAVGTASLIGEGAAGLADLGLGIAQKDSNLYNEEGWLDRWDKQISDYYDENDFVNSELDKSEFGKNILKGSEFAGELLMPGLSKISLGKRVLKGYDALKASNAAKALERADELKKGKAAFLAGLENVNIKSLDEVKAANELAQKMEKAAKIAEEAAQKADPKTIQAARQAAAKARAEANEAVAKAKAANLTAEMSAKKYANAKAAQEAEEAAAAAAAAKDPSKMQKFGNALSEKGRKIIDYDLGVNAGKFGKGVRMVAPGAVTMIHDSDGFLPDMSFPQKQTTDEKPELSTEDRLRNVEKMLEEIRKNSGSSGSSSESSSDSSEGSGRRSAYAGRSTYGGGNVAGFHQSGDEA